MIDLSELVEVTLKEPDDFLKVKETLTRIGVASKNGDILYQSCHILHKQGRYFVMHFKELFLLDGKESDFTEEDRGRRNTIAALLDEWNLVKVVDPKKIAAPKVLLNHIKVLSHKEKANWTLVPKYSIGKKRRPD